jgi:hypothetical protein
VSAWDEQEKKRKTTSHPPAAGIEGSRIPMSQRNHKPNEVQREFATPWSELQYVCKRIRYWPYERESKASARRYLARLKRVLDGLPGNNSAILREEALGLFHELKGQTKQAIEHRRREIELTERLHDSVRASVEAGDYSARMAASILAGHNDAVLNERRAILRALQEQRRSSPAHKAS